MSEVNGMGGLGALPVGGRSLRGWNGTLVLNAEGVTIRRGLKGLIVRKRRDPDVEVAWNQIAQVRFAPARGVGGYVQIIERSSPLNARDYLETIRARTTVTFARRSERWRQAAEEIATRSGASLEVGSAARYWSSVVGTRGTRNSTDRREL